MSVGVQGPQGRYEIAAKFLVGADGAHSIVRKQCGIGFPGITDRGFVGRSGQVAIHPPVAVPGTGELEVPGVGRLRPATFTRTENGLFAYGMFQPGLYRVAVHEWAPSPLEDSDTMPLEELRDAVRRVVGGDVPMSEPPGGEPRHCAGQPGSTPGRPSRYRHGRVFLVGDCRTRAQRRRRPRPEPRHARRAQPRLETGGQRSTAGHQKACSTPTRASGIRWASASSCTPAHRRHCSRRALTSPPCGSCSRSCCARQRQRPAHRRPDGRGGYPLRHVGAAGRRIQWPGDGCRTSRCGTGRGPTRVAGLLRPARPILLTFADRADLADAARTGPTAST